MLRAVPLLTLAVVALSATVIASAPPIPVSLLDLPPPIAVVFTTWLPSASSVTLAPLVSVPLMAAVVVLCGVMFKPTETPTPVFSLSALALASTVDELVLVAARRTSPAHASIVDVLGSTASVVVSA